MSDPLLSWVLWQVLPGVSWHKGDMETKQKKVVFDSFIA